MVKTIKSSVFIYFFVALWGLLFGGAFVFVFLNGKGIVRFFDGDWEPANALNSLPFLLIGLVVLLLWYRHLTRTYWFRVAADAFHIRNLVHQRNIPWSSIKSIEPLGGIKLPITKLITQDEKTYYLHYPVERLRKLLEAQ